MSREWLSATRNGVRALYLKDYDACKEGYRLPPRGLPDALAPYPYQLSSLPNLESLFVKGISIPPIECSITPSLLNLKVLHYTYLGVRRWEETRSKEHLRALLKGCVQLRELKCDFNLQQFYLLREIASLTALTSLSLHTHHQWGKSWLGELSGAASLSDTVTRLVCLEELTLCGPRPTSISPACFYPDSRLRSITLRCGNLQRLPDSFASLHRLESLELDVTSFRRLPDFTPLTSLTCLDVQCGMEETKVDWRCLFSDLPWLKVLRVSSLNNLHRIPAKIGCYTRLEALHLFNLPFFSLPESFGQLRSLTELELEFCKSLRSVPESFSQLQSLQQLEMDDLDDLQVLQETVELPSCLTSLKICLAHLPDCLWSCQSLQKLHVANLESSSLPEAMGQLTSLTKLTISHCDGLKSLPASLHHLPLLQSVTINSCGVLSRADPPGFRRQLANGYGMVHGHAVPPLESLIHLPSLTSLTLHHCFSLTRLPGLRAASSRSSSSNRHSSGNGSGSGGCSRLARVSISGCNLSHLPHSLGSLTSLTYLEVVDCSELLTLPHSLGSLSSLAWMELISVGLKSLPESFGSLSSLRVLKIAHCSNLCRLPHSFGQLLQLSSLNVEHCPLELLPGPQALLPSLRELFIDGAGITLTPDFIPHLPALTLLKISQLKEFLSLNSRQAPGLGLFPSLKTLTFANCGEQEQLPEYFWQMTRLTSLTMGDFPKLRSNPDSLLDMPALERLEVEYMCLSAFPPTVSRLCSLTSLILRDTTSWQDLAALPDWVCKLPALKHLLVDGQWIAALPEGIGSLSRLESLKIVAPTLRDLPTSLGHLGKLTGLALERCAELRHLPDSFTQLVGLKRVWLTDCCLLASVPLVDGQLPGGCKLVVRECPRLKLQVNNVHVDAMSEGGEEVGSGEGITEGMNEGSEMEGGEGYGDEMSEGDEEEESWEESMDGMSESDEEEEVGERRCACGCM